MKANFKWVNPFMMVSDKIKSENFSEQFKIEIEREDLPKNMVLLKYKKNSEVFRFLFKKTNEELNDIIDFCQKIIDNPTVSPLEID